MILNDCCIVHKLSTCTDIGLQKFKALKSDQNKKGQKTVQLEKCLALLIL